MIINNATNCVITNGDIIVKEKSNKLNTTTKKCGFFSKLKKLFSKKEKGIVIKNCDIVIKR
jgi:hypothetical protein